MTMTDTARTFRPAEIALTSGGWFDFAEPARSRFTLLDVAGPLSRIPRFTGQGTRAYSVAEHLVHCSRLVPEDHALDALLHDAHEAFVGDMASPLKELCPDYAEIETRAAAHVIPRLGGTWPLPGVVKRADLQMLLVEKSQHLRCGGRWPVLDGITDPLVALRFWDPAEAFQAWLTRYAELHRG